MSRIASAIVLLITQCLFLSQSLAAPSEAQYELQERCGRRAEEWFRREWGNGMTAGKTLQTITTYRNHFNARLNKCFMLLSSLNTPANNSNAHPSTQISLFDVNEMKDYGYFFKLSDSISLSQCYVEGTRCKSQEEWEALIAPYMDD